MLPFMKKDPKSLATLVLEVGKKGETKSKKTVSKDGVDQDMTLGLDMAAEDVLKALEAKDASSLSSALKDFISLCAEEESYTEPAEEVEA